MFPALLPILPAVPPAPWAVAAVALAYVLTQREIDANLSIR